MRFLTPCAHDVVHLCVRVMRVHYQLTIRKQAASMVAFIFTSKSMGTVKENELNVHIYSQVSYCVTSLL